MSLRPPFASRLAVLLACAAMSCHAAPHAELDMLPDPAAQAAGLSGIFLPGPNGRDFVATYVVKRGWGPPGDDSAVVSRSGGWLRVDKVENHQASTDYIGVTVPVAVMLTRDEAGGYRNLQIDAAAYPRSADILFDSYKTAAKDTPLGERCDVWSVYRQAPEGRSKGFERTGCVTADGIELWRKTVGNFGEINAAHAVRVQRRRVPPGEVHPPADLLDLKAWDVAETPGAADFDVELTPDREPNLKPMTVRRHGGWLYEDRTDFGRGRMVFSRRLDGATQVSASFDAAGTPKLLSIQRWTPTNRPSPAMESPMTDKGDMVLGEPCAWIDAMPFTADAGRHECRAADGAPLRIVFIVWASTYSYTATRVRRDPLTLAQVLPPADLLKPTLWGFPK